MICTHCSTEIAEKALICYRCGHATTEPRVKPPASGPLFDRPRRRRPPMAAIVGALILLALIFWFLFGKPWVNSQLDTPGIPNAQLRTVAHPQPPTLRAAETFTTSRRVLTADSPTRARRQEHLSRGRRLRRGRCGPVRGEPRRGCETAFPTPIPAARHGARSYGLLASPHSR